MVVGIDVNGCIDTAYVNVSLFPYPSFQTSNDVQAFYGDQIQLEAYSDLVGSYVWSPAEYLSCIHCQNPIATPDQEITYEVTFTDLNGCSAEQYITITFDACVYVPNTFTPNNDGMNDVFQISGGNFVEMECLIFNRWGELVYTLDSPNEVWDGTFNGIKCQDGTYVWKLTYTDFTNDEYQISGHVNLLR
jgi:gliding motility-associated-like protein